MERPYIMQYHHMYLYIYNTFTYDDHLIYKCLNRGTVDFFRWSQEHVTPFLEDAPKITLVFLKHILLLPIVRKVKIGMVSQLILGVPIQNQADIELEWHVVFLCRERSWSQIPDMFFFGVRSGAGIGVLLACAMQT